LQNKEGSQHFNVKEVLNFVYSSTQSRPPLGPLISLSTLSLEAIKLPSIRVGDQAAATRKTNDKTAFLRKLSSFATSAKGHGLATVFEANKLFHNSFFTSFILYVRLI
jgi:hypothetical protein